MDYKVKQGDCLSSIAYAHGFFWRTLWQLDDNSDLRDERGSPNILYPGDTVVIPPLRMRDEDCSTDARHRFRFKGVPAKLNLRFLEDGEPLAGEPYQLRIDGAVVDAPPNLDDDGRLSVVIPPNARLVEYRFSDSEEWIAVDLGTLDPASKVSGIQARLNNLGYEAGGVDGIAGPRTAAALARFQEDQGIDITGDLDDDTRDHLVKAHGC
jgi:N-acetylmuramoyl-L-alanine amidase